MAKMQDLTKCYRCGAKYDAAKSFMWGTTQGTSGNFIPIGPSVEKGDCPICRKPLLLKAPYPHQQECM